NQVKELHTISAKNLFKISVIQHEDLVLVVVLQSKGDKKSSLVYTFQSNDAKSIEWKQTVKDVNDDVLLWTFQNNIHMLLAEGNGLNITMYLWKTTYFDVQDTLTIKQCQNTKFDVFIEENTVFLAIACKELKSGEDSSYSYLYECPDSIACVYRQAFRTYNPEHVKFFSVNVNDEEWQFLIFANFFMTEGNNTDYNIYSVIYIYDSVKTAFVPFQGLKLNGAYYFLPVKTSSGAFILLAATKNEGIKAFQFDGLKFVKAEVQYSQEAFSRDISIMRYGLVNGFPLVGNYKEMGKWFKVRFTKRKIVNRYHDDLLTWCKESIKNLESSDMESHIKTIEKAPKYTDPVLKLESNINFTSVEIDNLYVTNEDLEETLSKTEETDLGRLERRLEKHVKDLNKVEKQIQSALHKSGTNHFKRNVHVEELLLNKSPSSFNSATIEMINGYEIAPIIENVLDIDEGFVTNESFEFDRITINNEFQPESINELSGAEIFCDVVVEGDAILNEVNLDGKLGDITFSKHHILLNEEDQVLSGLHIVNTFSAKQLEVNNERNAHMFSTATVENSVLSNVNRVKARKMTVGSYINEVDIPSLHKHALRKEGDQTIIGEYTFDTLHLDNINTETLSGENIKESVILTDNSTYTIDDNVAFSNYIRADSVYISNNLNNIRVFEDGKLDLLLTNVQDVQHIDGFKQFEDLELLNPIDLHGKSKKLDELNPTKSVNKEIILTGDYTINGNVKVIKNLQSDDLQSLNLYSVKQLQADGLHIEETHIPMHFNFMQNLNVKQTWLDAINDIEVNSFITMGDASSEILVTAPKKFLGDVFVAGSASVEKINSLDMQKFQSEIVQLDSNLKLTQSLSGKYHFENIVAHRIDNIKTYFNGHLWDEIIMANEVQTIEGTTIIDGDLKANKINSNMITCNKIKGYDFTKIIKDTIIDSPNRSITGKKQFQSLTVENLTVSKLIEPQNLPDYKNATYDLTENLELPDNIIIEQIFFNGKFNNLSKDELGWWFGAANNIKVIKSDTNFKEINIEGNLQVDSINKVKISDIVDNSVKIDEEFYFNKMTVNHTDGIASHSTVILEGHFESLDIHDIFLANIVEPQSISDEIIFHSNVTVDGEIVFDGLISKLNLTEYCSFPRLARSGEKSKLHVEGNIIFKKPLQIETINNLSKTDLMNNVWFKDETTLITGAIDFNDIHFKENAVVLGLLNEKKIELMSKTYFSKTLDQDVSATLEFENVGFDGGVSAKQARISGILGREDFGELMRTILLQDFSQMFEFMPAFEDCKILNLTGNYKLNGLDFANDVMLFDKENYVTGRKVISDVHTSVLDIPEGYDTHVYVQNVNIIHLLQAAVLKQGRHRLTGKISFKGYTTFLDGIRSEYPIINGIRFNNETIMLKSVPQNITSIKMFHPKHGTESDNSENATSIITFKTLQVKDGLNGIDMEKLLERQAYKNEDTVFKNKMNFNGSIAMYNVNIEKLYNDVNISELIQDIIQFSKEDNFLNSYQKLYSAAEHINKSLMGQAHYLDYYEIRQIYKEKDFIIPVKLENPDVKHLACVVKSTFRYNINFQVWDEQGEVFRKDNELNEIVMDGILHYLTTVTYKGKEYWYIELDGFKGTIYKITKEGLEQVTQTLSHRGTKSVVSVVLPDENRDCFFLLYAKKGELYCADVEQVTNNYPIKLDLYQVFNYIHNGFKAISVLIEGIPHIFIVNNQEQGNINIWRKGTGSKFEIKQVIYISNPNSIAFTFSQGDYYLAIASGHVQQAKYPGFLDIRKFNKDLKEFKTIQKIDINVPLEVEFAVLPTKELILYVLTENPVKPLVVYEYQGISGFKEKIIGSTLPKVTNMKSFNTRNDHFILANNMQETRVIQAIFKGKINL
ncbi:hypothetical protein ILUMI_13089, partial [Ignelater luminosus]